MRIGKSKNSIFVRIFVPILLLLIVQVLVLQVLMYIFNVYGDLRDNAYDILNERVVGRKNEIENYLHTGTDFDMSVSTLTKLYENYAAADDSPQVFASDNSQRDFLIAASDTMINMLRHNKVNGVFVALNDLREFSAIPRETNRVNGLSIRDLDSTIGYNNTEDLLINRGSRVVVEKLGLDLDAGYDPYYTFDPHDDRHSFYYKPLTAAFETEGYDYDDLAYFQGTHRVSDTEADSLVVSYSMPLISKDGIPFGVIGIEITARHLRSLMNYAELADETNGAYAIAQVRGDNQTYSVSLHSGTYYEKAFADSAEITVSGTMKNDCYDFVGQNSRVCGSIAEFQIYNSNGYFSDEKLVLIGVVDKNDLLAFGTKIQINIIISLLLGVLVGVVCLVFIIKRILSPIVKLYEKVRASDGLTELHFEKTNIDEVDRLTESIEELGRKVNSNKVKSEFFSRMSHDMRTPMNAIIGFSSKELTENASEEQKTEYLRQINESGRYLLGLINDILDINKLENDKITLLTKSVALCDAWDMIIPIITEVAACKNVIFVSRLNLREPDVCVMLDVKRFSQIFINLLSNAVKFTDEGGTVTLDVDAWRDENLIVQKVVIKDTGSGMSEDFQEIVYEQFTQENPEKEGTGLGLSIAKSLVDMMGGSIDFQSELGKGTEFVVEISCDVADACVDIKSNIDSAANNKSSDKELDGKRILICEDNEINAEIAAELLANKNVICDFAENGSIGLEKFADSVEGYYDAILMDMRMPEMDGLTATKKIREMDRGDALTVKIIAMTANAFDEDIDACRAAGMNAHIAKPIEPTLFYSVIAEELANGSAETSDDN